MGDGHLRLKRTLFLSFMPNQTAHGMSMRIIVSIRNACIGSGNQRVASESEKEKNGEIA